MSPLIVVSGATKGIGRSVSELFASKGFDLAVCARNAIDLQAMKADIENKNPGVKCHTFVVDMSVKAEVLAFAEGILALNRPVDVLVNNAGVFIPGQIHNESDGALEKMIDTNLYSAYHLSRALIPAMKERKSGYIFNMCSIASFMAYEHGGSYAVSKFAMLGMSKCLRAELKAFDIRVTAVMPGATLTDSWAGVDLPEERFMKPEDVAEAIWTCYSLSPRTVVEELILRPQMGDI